jgi:hypothetical protein
MEIIDMDNNMEAIWKSIRDLEGRITKLEQSLQQRGGEVDDATSTSKKLSFRELMRIAKPPTNVEKVLLVGYYLEQHEGFKCFNATDVEQVLSVAKEQELSNSLAFINQNIRNGNIMEAKEKKDNRKTYTLTASGEDLVAKSLSQTEE